MSTEETGTTVTDETTTEAAVSASDASGDGGDTGANPEYENLPEWARSAIKKGNDEAKKYRLQLREAQDALKAASANAGSLEELQKSLADLEAKNAQLARESLTSRIAAKYNLPDALASLLKGDSEDDIEKHAKDLAQFVVNPVSADPRGGLTPNDAGDGDMDPRSLAKKYGTRRR